MRGAILALALLTGCAAQLRTPLAPTPTPTPVPLTARDLVPPAAPTPPTGFRLEAWGMDRDKVIPLLAPATAGQLGADVHVAAPQPTPAQAPTPEPLDRLLLMPPPAPPGPAGPVLEPEPAPSVVPAVRRTYWLNRGGDACHRDESCRWVTTGHYRSDVCPSGYHLCRTCGGTSR